jgi:hypothetical protein
MCWSDCFCLSIVRLLLTVSRRKFAANRRKPGQQALSLSKVEAIVQERYPAGRLWMLDVPKSREGVYKVMKKEVTELSWFIGYRDVAIDQYSGKHSQSLR